MLGDTCWKAAFRAGVIGIKKTQTWTLTGLKIDLKFVHEIMYYALPALPKWCFRRSILVLYFHMTADLSAVQI